MLQPLVRVVSEFCLLGVESARGIASDSSPISSALSVIALFEVPEISCRNLAM